MTAADRLNEIEARANAATEGPWEAYRPNPAYRIYEICSTTPQGLDETLAEVSGYNASDDAEFIAHARTDMPDLVAALRAVLYEVAKVQRDADAVAINPRPGGKVLAGERWRVAEQFRVRIEEALK